MRFRAELLDSKCLSNILISLDKVAQHVLIVLDRDNFQLRVSHDSLNEVNVFVVIPVEALFDGFRIESKNNNTIGLLVKSQHLVAALRNGDKAQRIIVKLHKKDDKPCLKIAMTIDGNHIIQHVPVALQTARRIQETQEPSDIPVPDVKIVMPPIKTLKSVVSRMRSVGYDLSIKATLAGELNLQVSAELVSIKTFYKNLRVPGKGEERSGDAKRQGEPEPRGGSCTMDIRKLSSILSTRIVGESNYVVGCIVENHAFVLYAELGYETASATFYIPILSSGN